MASVTVADTRITTLKPRKSARDIRDADDIGPGRSLAAAMRAAIWQDGSLPTPPEETVFEAVVDAAFCGHERQWKRRCTDLRREGLHCQSARTRGAWLAGTPSSLAGRSQSWSV